MDIKGHERNTETVVINPPRAVIQAKQQGLYILFKDSTAIEDGWCRKESQRLTTPQAMWSSGGWSFDSTEIPPWTFGETHVHKHTLSGCWQQKEERGGSIKRLYSGTCALLASKVQPDNITSKQRMPLQGPFLAFGPVHSPVGSIAVIKPVTDPHPLWF